MQGITKQIELFRADTGMSYIESFLDFCELKDIDPEEIINEIDKPLKAKISNEFIEKGMTKQRRSTSTLEEFF